MRSGDTCNSYGQRVRVLALPSFDEDLETPKIVAAGRETTWNLPTIDAGDYPMQEVIIEPEGALASELSYLAET